MTFLCLEGVGKVYGTTVALDRIDLEVPAGNRMAIVGPSGSGKSTLLRVVAGFEMPDSGRVTLDGQVLADGASFVPAHRREIGIVSQDGALFPHLSVADNIGFGIDRDVPDRTERVLRLMDNVELDRRLSGRRPHELSGGQQQRVALARAIARNPKLMLFDEPFSSLDAGLRDSMRKVIADVLQAAGMTSVLVTHDQVEALSFADRIAILQDGRLVQVGTPRDVYFHPKDPRTARFLGEAIVLPAMLGDGWVECGLGRISADTVGRRGPGEIMLRPDQLCLEPVAGGLPASGSNPTACFGRITAVEFGGAVCTIGISLMKGSPLAASYSDGPAANVDFKVRGLSIDLPPIGEMVRISVLGQAHVFDRTT